MPPEDRQCQHTGCRAWTVRNESWCRAHHPALPHTGGAPRRNQNAVTHGLYRKWFTPVERAELEQLTGELGADALHSEIALLRVAISRVLADPSPELSPAVKLQHLGQAVRSLSAALRAQRQLSGERTNDIAGALETVLTELGLDPDHE